MSAFRGRHPPLRVYLGTLAVLFVIAAAASALYVRQRARDDAEHAALEDARVESRVAAKDLSDSIALVQTTVSRTAASPALARILEQPSACTLSFAGAGIFTGYGSVISPAGTVVCSSKASEVGKSPYAGMEWFEAAKKGPILTGPLPDPATGGQVLISASPIAGGAVLAGVVALNPVGGALASRYGGSRNLQFVAATAGGLVLAHSSDAAQWVGKSLTGTSFISASDASSRTDLDGTERIFGEAPVAGTDWQVFAGAKRADALADADTLFFRQSAIILIGLAVVFVGSLVVYFRITRPIRRLSRGLETATASGGSLAPVESTGPAEIARLADDVNALILSVSRELDERQRAEAVAQASERNYRLLFENNPQPAWVFDAATLQIVEVNEAAIALYDLTREEFLTSTVADISSISDDLIAKLTEGGSLNRHGPVIHQTPDGITVRILVTAYPVEFQGRQGCVVIAEDITERARLEHQLRQSQRLESLGQLAGGVAHDFNNLLNVVLNYAAFVGDEIVEAAKEPGGERWEPVYRDVEQIQQAVERAARLTHQLLSFSRQEIIQPKVLRMNEVVSGLENLLQRTLGPQVVLTTSLEPALQPVFMDAGQLEQLLINLAVNARDAMPGGGSLTIDTANVAVDAMQAASRPNLSPGPYVRVRVSDTGVGMDQSVIDRAFEPFFSTKPRGQGTGLGLATVYGIVRQAGGDVRIYSEKGHGTTFTAFFPAAGDVANAASADLAELDPDADRQGGTVLLVEDEPALRESTMRILESHGYVVLPAASGVDAIATAHAHDGDIDLLLTDVVMPEMLGKEVAQHVTTLRPGVRVLYASGYARPVLGSQGTLDAGVALLEKPFSEHLLIQKVREALASVA